MSVANKILSKIESIERKLELLEGYLSGIKDDINFENELNSESDLANKFKPVKPRHEKKKFDDYKESSKTQLEIQDRQAKAYPEMLLEVVEHRAVEKSSKDAQKALLKRGVKTWFNTSAGRLSNSIWAADVNGYVFWDKGIVTPTEKLLLMVKQKKESDK